MLSEIRQVPFWDRLARLALPLVLVIWLAWLLADSVWLFWQGPTPVGHGDLPVIRSAQQSSSAPVLSEAQARRWELFGSVEVEPARQDPRDAPETRLRLELLGVFQHPDPAVASAIIAEQGRDARLVRPGDSLPGNATLEEVYADQVILNRMGQREALRLQSSDVSGIDVRQRQSSPARPAAQPDRSGRQRAQGGDGSDLAGQRQQIISRMGLTPHDQGGYLISESAPPEMLSMIGLRPGDVILSVNGNTLGSEQADLAALENFRNTGFASIVVERGDQRFTVNYPP